MLNLHFEFEEKSHSELKNKEISKQKAARTLKMSLFGALMGDMEEDPIFG